MTWLVQALYAMATRDNPVDALDPVRVMLVVGTGLLLQVATVALFGGTPGKLLLGLRVIAADSGVSPPGWGRALLRWLVVLTFFVPGAGRLIGAGIVLASSVLIFSHPMRQTLWDRFAGTMVIQVPRH